MDSILTSIKKQLGIDENYEHFDQDIILLINSAFSVLGQLGFGPMQGFSITDKNDTWTSIFEENGWSTSSVKEFVFLKVKLIFDPPTTSSVIDAYQKRIAELEWRIMIEGDVINGD